MAVTADNIDQNGANDGSTANGASVVQTERTSGDHQKWRFNPL